MKLIITLEISPETAAAEEITLESLRSFAEELKQDAVRTIPHVTATVEALP